MIQENLIFIAVAVFLAMLVGLVFTIIEFKYGEPKRQVEEQVVNEHPER